MTFGDLEAEAKRLRNDNAALAQRMRRLYHELCADPDRLLHVEAVDAAFGATNAAAGCLRILNSLIAATAARSKETPS